MSCPKLISNIGQVKLVNCWVVPKISLIGPWKMTCSLLLVCDKMFNFINWWWWGQVISDLFKSISQTSLSRWNFWPYCLAILLGRFTKPRIGLLCFAILTVKSTKSGVRLICFAILTVKSSKLSLKVCLYFTVTLHIDSHLQMVHSF